MFNVNVEMCYMYLEMMSETQTGIWTVDGYQNKSACL